MSAGKVSAWKVSQWSQFSINELPPTYILSANSSMHWHGIEWKGNTRNFHCWKFVQIFFLPFSPSGIIFCSIFGEFFFPLPRSAQSCQQQWHYWINSMWMATFCRKIKLELKWERRLEQLDDYMLVLYRRYRSCRCTIPQCLSTQLRRWLGWNSPVNMCSCARGWLTTLDSVWDLFKLFSQHWHDIADPPPRPPRAIQEWAPEKRS